MIHANLPYFLCMVLFVIGIYAIVAKTLLTDTSFTRIKRGVYKVA